MRWVAFSHGGKHYALDHLHPREVVYVQEAKGDLEQRRYRANVSFSMHCFTRRLRAGEVRPQDLLYSDGRETRVFDFQRYGLSIHLPAIIDNLPGQKCFHTDKGNFFTVQLVSEDGTESVKYEIFFKAYKPAAKGALNLIIESAYARDAAHPRRERVAPIGFHVILFNTLNGKMIRFAG